MDLDDLIGVIRNAVGNAVSPRTKRNLRNELSRSFLAKLGIVLLVVVVLAAVFAPLIAPWNPTSQDLDNKQQPPLGFSRAETQVSQQTTADGDIEIVNQTVYVNATAEHPLGTDGLGRDMLSRVIYGARTSLLVGVFGTVLAMLLGVPAGLVSGYYSGRVDDALMRFADVSLAFPSLVLAIALVGLWGQAAVSITDPLVALGIAPAIRGAISLPWGLTYPTGMPESFTLPGTVIVVVGLVNWVWFARVARGESLALREQEYVKAARSLGGSDGFIIRKHVLPNSLTPILVLATIQVAAIILLESALSFLGFSGTTLSWGFDIAQGRQYQTTAWWIATMPGLAIVLTVIGINLIGDWLRDALDPGIEGEGGGV
ncbi:ABC transporter permease [Halorarius halobius]|uniref:ABC transporter permease n=1 Tax=Halorarius halobius TaxID=2962671 RepID=UPI0020CDF3C4|nr:ABC transporter permease [Halorarius halobius]